MLDKTSDLAIEAEAWLKRLEVALSKADESALKALFHGESYWRDVLALSWNMQTLNGAPAILEGLKARVNAPQSFALAPDRASPRWVTRAGTNTIEAIFTFETAIGRGNGILRLTPENGELRAWTLLTALEELKGFEEQLEKNGRADRPIHAISAAPTGSTSARRRTILPIASRPCSWSAADRRGSRSRHV